MTNEEEIILVYDNECPVCNSYCKTIDSSSSNSKIRLISARSNNPIIAELVRNGFNIDRGMVLIIGGRYYYGADAIHILASINTKSSWFNRINYWIFRSQTRSRFIYPILRLGRSILLLVIGKNTINNKQ